MSQPFQFTSPNPLIAQPAGAGEKLIFRSTQAADTGNLSLTGLVSATSTTDTAALTGKHEKQTTDTFTSLTIGKLSVAQTGDVHVYGQGTAGNGFIFYSSLPANNNTLIIGVIGYERTYTYKTSLTGAANEIKIAATVAAQATNLYEALNAGANAGTDYGTGTTAHADIIGSAPSGANVPIADRIAVLRLLAWSFSQTGTAHSLQVPIGGVTGTLLATLATLTTMAYDSFTLSSEDTLTLTLPALFIGSSDAIAINGRPFILEFKDDGAGNDSVVANYQTSTDAVNWATGLTALSAHLDAGNGTQTPQLVKPSELLADYVRLNITANTNTASLGVDGQVISG